MPGGLLLEWVSYCCAELKGTPWHVLQKLDLLGESLQPAWGWAQGRSFTQQGCAAPVLKGQALTLTAFPESKQPKKG